MAKEKINTPAQRILIHTCCADCLLNSLNYLVEENIINKKTEVVSYYYNPNIHPRSEYLTRLDALRIVVRQERGKGYNVNLIVPDYSPKEYFKEVMKKSEKKCIACWTLRIEKSFGYAKENNIRIVSTTLLTSHYQDRDMILKIVTELGNKHDIEVVGIDSTSNCKNSGFYKQNYCGCCFSLSEKMVESYM